MVIVVGNDGVGFVTGNTVSVSSSAIDSDTGDRDRGHFRVSSTMAGLGVVVVVHVLHRRN